jgi:serine/threonine-protein kinase
MLDDGSLFLVSEYIEGPSLRRLLEETPAGTLPWQRVTRLALQLADGLEAIHREGVIHRDIKPENIILRDRSKDADAVIVDLGNAVGVLWERLTNTGLVWGSVPYMSPEQAAGRTDLDARSDLYSLGIVIYELLCGQRPFDAAAEAELMQHHWSTPAPDLTVDAPEQLAEVVGWLLAKDPAERPASARVVRCALAPLEMVRR